MTRAAVPSDRRKVVYSLTAKGEGLLPVFVSMRQWGEEWGHGTPKVLLADKRDGRPVRKICLMSHDGRPLVSTTDMTSRVALALQPVAPMRLGEFESTVRQRLAALRAR